MNRRLRHGLVMFVVFFASGLLMAGVSKSPRWHVGGVVKLAAVVAVGVALFEVVGLIAQRRGWLGADDRS